MICEKCRESGQRSTVTGGASMSTLMNCSPWYDENGRYHSHDTNWTTTTYRCSNGHSWSVKEQGHCPTCGWQGGREIWWDAPVEKPFIQCDGSHVTVGYEKPLSPDFKASHES